MRSTSCRCFLPPARGLEIGMALRFGRFDDWLDESEIGKKKIQRNIEKGNSEYFPRTLESGEVRVWTSKNFHRPWKTGLTCGRSRASREGEKKKSWTRKARPLFARRILSRILPSITIRLLSSITHRLLAIHQQSSILSSRAPFGQSPRGSRPLLPTSILDHHHLHLFIRTHTHT